MSERDIFGWLKFGDYRKIFETIMETPKSAKAIATLKRTSLSEVAEKLERLESIRAVNFSEGRWKATDLGIKVWKKYFG